jgi:ferredoxin
MGHITLKQNYEKLRKRLDGNAIGAPAHPAIYDILSIIFSTDEAELCARMPYGFSSTRKLARILKVREEELLLRLEVMADKGILFDFSRKGRSYWYLNPLVIGFFEFTMMRVRDNVDQHRLAHSMYEYMFEDPALAFIKEVGVNGETQLFRTLVHEDQLPSDYVEVLDWERATSLIDEASAWAVGLCHCRHIAEHRGSPCTQSAAGLANPMEICLSLGEPANYFIRREMARKIDKSEALEIMIGAREAGLVQLADNVQKRPNFMCNCCKCCCEFLKGYRELGDRSFTLTSNYLPVVDDSACTRCGVCEQACPVEAISVRQRDGSNGSGKKRLSHEVVIDKDLCIGCGVCATSCSRGAITMSPLKQRIHTPETTLERVMLQAVERGKLANLLFDDPGNVTHTALRLFFKVLLSMPPAKQLLASKQLKSRFVDFLIRGAKGRPGADT